MTFWLEILGTTLHDTKTLYLTPSTQSEESFNASLCRTRVLIEHFWYYKKVSSTPCGVPSFLRPSGRVQNGSCYSRLSGNVCVQQNCTDIDVAACIQQHVQETGRVNEGILERESSNHSRVLLKKWTLYNLELFCFNLMSQL